MVDFETETLVILVYNNWNCLLQYFFVFSTIKRHKELQAELHMAEGIW